MKEDLILDLKPFGVSPGQLGLDRDVFDLEVINAEANYAPEIAEAIRAADRAIELISKEFSTTTQPAAATSNEVQKFMADMGADSELNLEDLIEDIAWDASDQIINRIKKLGINKAQVLTEGWIERGKISAEGIELVGFISPDNLDKPLYIQPTSSIANMGVRNKRAFINFDEAVYEEPKAPALILFKGTEKRKHTPAPPAIFGKRQLELT